MYLRTESRHESSGLNQKIRCELRSYLFIYRKYLLKNDTLIRYFNFDSPSLLQVFHITHFYSKSRLPQRTFWPFHAPRPLEDHIGPSSDGRSIRGINLVGFVNRWVAIMRKMLYRFSSQHIIMQFMNCKSVPVILFKIWSRFSITFYINFEFGGYFYLNPEFRVIPQSMAARSLG